MDLSLLLGYLDTRRAIWSIPAISTSNQYRQNDLNGGSRSGVEDLRGIYQLMVVVVDHRMLVEVSVSTRRLSELELSSSRLTGAQV